MLSFSIYRMAPVINTRQQLPTPLTPLNDSYDNKLDRKSLKLKKAIL